ncbi:ACAD11 [Symbiodinium sp. CCMP2456]|nr:ACAD11 [Symbiodinium sp. CCMP2456]
MFTSSGCRYAVLAILAFAPCCSAAANQCCKYSPTATFDTLGFFRSLHKEHGVNAYCFFGGLVGAKDTYALTFLIQKVPPFLSIVPVYELGGGFNTKTIQTYDLDASVTVSATVEGGDGKKPWTAQSSSLLTGFELSVSAVGDSAVPGQAGVGYDLKVHSKKKDFDIVVRFRDMMGVVRQGFGPDGFLPNWLSEEQRDAANSKFGGAVDRYLAGTPNATLDCQGSYYFSMPLLQVESFEIQQAGKVVDSGKSGMLWSDYVVQTYDDKGKALLKNVSWQFFALQFPDVRSAMMITAVNTADGVFQEASLFQGSGDNRTTWTLDNVKISPRGQPWTSPASHDRYYLSYDVTMKNPDAQVSLEVEWPEQEVGLGKIFKYEGLARATARWPGGGSSHGTGWVELQPLGPVEGRSSGRLSSILFT